MSWPPPSAPLHSEILAAGKVVDDLDSKVGQAANQLRGVVGGGSGGEGGTPSLRP